MAHLLAPVDLAAARRTLREQIARLERELARTLATTYPRIATPPGDSGPPRLLDVEALEAARDALAARVTRAQRRASEQRDRQAVMRAQLEQMLADPAAFKGAVIRNADLGLPGCTTYRVVPRLLGGWWRVKISSGCPLEGGHPLRPTPIIRPSGS